MGFLTTVALLAGLALPQPTSRDSGCPDPAAPLLSLAAAYDRWPARPPGIKPKEAWEKASTYFRTYADRDYRKALFAYQNLEQEFPRDMHIKMVLAILYSAGPDLNILQADGYRHVANLSFSNADTRAVRKLKEVMAHDSTHWITAVALTRNALVTTEKRRIGEAYELIARGLSADPSSTPLHLAWSDLLVREGRHAEALAYVRARPVSCAAQMHALAEALMLTGDTATGSRLYLTTLAEARPDELDRFYDDVRVMMTVGQIKTYKSLAPLQRAPWLLAYWHRTAAASGRGVQIRVAEQTVRAAYANANFRAFWYQGEKAQNRLAVITDTSHVVPWNAAGVFYVRHGPPDIRYNSSDGPVEHEAWVYRQMQPATYVMLSRSKSPVDDWSAAVTPTCSRTYFLGRFDRGKADEHIASGGSLTVREMFYALAQTIDPQLHQWIRECQLVTVGMPRLLYDKMMIQYRYDNTRMYRKLVQQESSLPHFRPGVRIAVAAYQFRTPTGQPEAVLVPSIPVADLRTDARVAERLRISYAITDTLVASFSHDTIVALPANVTTGIVRVPFVWRSPTIRSGSLRVTVTDAADSLNGATRSIPFSVHADRDRLSISDIVIADAGVTGPLVRGAHRLSPLPDHRVQSGDTYRIFFELYGVAEGETVATTIHMRRTDQKNIREQLGLSKREEKTITFSDGVELDSRGIAARDAELTGDLAKGTYSIDVTVTLGSGVVAKRSGVLIVE